MQIELANAPVGLHNMAALSEQTSLARYLTAVVATSVVMVMAETTYFCRVLLLRREGAIREEVQLLLLDETVARLTGPRGRKVAKVYGESDREDELM